MGNDLKLPELGENVESGTVTEVLVSVGDEIEKDQPVIELETDKAVVEVPADAGGTVSEIRASAGDELKVGDVILVLDGTTAKGKGKQTEAAETTPDEDERDKAETQDEAEEAEPEEPKKDASAGEKKTRAKKKGGAAAGAAAAADKEAEDTAEESDDDDAPEAESGEGEDAGEAAPEEESDSKTGKGPVRAAPSVRRLAREIGVDLGAVRASTGGVITADDVKTAARSKTASGKGGGAPLAAPSGEYTLPNFEKYGPVTREAMSKIRSTTAKNMARSWASIPHVTQHDKADITELEAFRERFGKMAEQAGGKLTVTAILVRILAEGLKRFPQFSASLDPEKGEVVYKQYYNVGVAVDTDHGLLVPVIRDADKKSFIDIAVELKDMSERARARKTSLDELAGSCMTITNLGGIGGTSFTPIVNLPEVAILGVSRASVEAVYRDGAFEPRTMMPISLSYDHRVIDGAAAARFARWMCLALEQPLSMFLEG